jgi:hypothetical protein
MGLGSPASLLVGPTRPPVPLVVMGALLAGVNRRAVSRAKATDLLLPWDVRGVER